MTSCGIGATTYFDAKPAIIEYVTTKGSKAYVTQNGGEGELIFPAKTKMKIISISKGATYPVLEQDLASPVPKLLTVKTDADKIHMKVEIIGDED